MQFGSLKKVHTITGWWFNFLFKSPLVGEVSHFDEFFMGVETTNYQLVVDFCMTFLFRRKF